MEPLGQTDLNHIGAMISSADYTALKQSLSRADQALLSPILSGPSRVEWVLQALLSPIL